MSLTDGITIVEKTTNVVVGTAQDMKGAMDKISWYCQLAKNNPSLRLTAAKFSLLICEEPLPFEEAAKKVGATFSLNNWTQGGKYFQKHHLVE